MNNTLPKKSGAEWSSFTPPERVKPFVKWAGGKGRLTGELTARLPRKFNRYFEPFVGGGALFFHLLPANAYLFDINDELINCYLTVRDHPEKLIKDLSKHRHEEDYFYKIRDLDRQPKYKQSSKIKRASRLIYLNKTCFNGLHRVNSKGHFNVPFGEYKNPKIVDRDNLRACSRALKGAHIECTSYSAVAEYAQPGDLIYFDPPYAPLNSTSNFTGYSKDGFTSGDQEALRDLCGRLHRKGAYFMVSNSFTPLITDLYSKYNIHLIDAARAINSKGTKRGKVKEVIVTNYQTA